MAISKEGIAINFVLINILYNRLRIMKLDFIKSAPPSTYTPGTIYFDNINNIIKVATDTNRYIVYSGVRSAEYDDATKVRSIVNQSGTEIDIDFSQYATTSDIHNGTLTILKNNVSVGTFSANQSANSSIDIQVNELPTVTTADDGKILKVSNGVWSAAYPTNIYRGSADPVNTTGNNGDIYLQTD